MTKKILVISPVPSHPQDAGNKTRIYSLLKNIKEMNYDVHFLHVRRILGDEEQMRECWGEKFYSAPYIDPERSTLVKKIVRKFKELTSVSPSTYLIDDWYDTSLNDFLISLLKKIKFDIVFVEYIFFSKALECFGKDILKVIDTHDVFTNRNKIFTSEYRKSFWFSTTAEEEAKGLNRADIIIAIQQKEKEFFSKLTDKKVVVVGHIVPLCQLAQKVLTKKKILFIGSENIINVQAVNYFVTNVYPQIQSEFPDVELLLVGRVCNVVADFNGCTKLGTIENLKVAYEMADLVINPVCSGTGLKIKNIEALGYSKPLVTSSAGAEGLEDGIDKAFLVADTSQEFSLSVSKIFTDIKLATSLSKNAYDFANKWNKENFNSIISILDEA